MYIIFLLHQHTASPKYRKFFVNIFLSPIYFTNITTDLLNSGDNVEKSMLVQSYVTYGMLKNIRNLTLSIVRQDTEIFSSIFSANIHKNFCFHQHAENSSPRYFSRQHHHLRAWCWWKFFYLCILYQNIRQQ